MAETFVGAVLEVVVSKVISITAEQINLARGFKKELTKLGDTLEMIKAFLLDAEERRTKNNSVNLWLQKLKDVAYEADDVLDGFSYEILRRKVENGNQMRKKLRNFFSPSNSIAFHFKMANKIKDILKSLDDLNKLAIQFGLQHNVVDHVSTVSGRSNMETVSFLDSSNIVGRKNDVSKVLDLLFNPKDDQDVSVVPIVGLGGLGKTTLAKLVYNDLDVERQFDVKFWVSVSYNFDVKRILKEMLDHFTNQQTLISESLNAIVEKLKERMEEKLKQKTEEKLKQTMKEKLKRMEETSKKEEAKGEKERIKYLLVLDDVWNVEKWEELKLCLTGISKNGGNRVIVTKRSQDVASAMQADPNQRYQPGRLEDEECWSIIKERALRGPPLSRELEIIGIEIAKQCQGVPLVARVIAGTICKIEMSRGAWLKIQKNDIWDSVESVLKLSFDHLSSPSLKKCFAYCAMFPKDYCFEKEQLVQLWMAQGFLGSSTAMVDIGNKYFNELLSNSLFQDVEKDTCGNILTFKMHDLVHDLAFSVSKIDTLIFNELSSSTTDEVSHIRHLNIGYYGESLARILTAVAPNLHSLFSEIDVFKKLSRSFTSLRVLKFSDTKYILELPASLGELKPLRYLDISRTSIHTLPRSTTRLYNLQTLRFLGCLEIRIPDGMRNLISLKHIHFDHHSSQPIELRHLTSLRTLPMFSVGEATLKHYHHIDALKSLDELSGQLRICNLQHVRDKHEACEANLNRKSKLFKVIFEWEGSNDNSKEVMEGLQPHSNLQSLTVLNYPGESFPSWMLRPGSNTGLMLLDNLKELEFIDCIICESLPPLGQLHNLQILKLKNMKKVKCMGNELYCNQDSDRKDEVMFPALKKLTLEGMESLEEWTTMAESAMFPFLEELNISYCPLLESVPLTGPCFSLAKLCIQWCSNLSSIGDGVATSTHLKELTIENCYNLCTLPNLEGFSSLRSLHVSDCMKLEIVPIRGRCSSLEELKIVGCEELWKIGDGLSTSTCLKELSLGNCPNLNSIPDLDGFSSLQTLSVRSCDKLEVIQIVGRCSSLEKLSISLCGKLSKIGDGLSTSTCLKELSLNGCPYLSSIPDLEGFSSLQNISIEDCSKLELVPVAGRCSSLEKLCISRCKDLRKIGNGLSTSTCLKELKLNNCDDLISIPDLEGFSSLQNISLDDCSKLEVLPIAGRCSSLEKLSISGCWKLSKIGDGLSSSTRLKELELNYCPNLSSIPDLEGFSSLQNLSVKRCKDLEVLPIVGRCSSLESLSIAWCEKLSKIGDGLSTSTHLKELSLSCCPKLCSIPDMKEFSSLKNLSVQRCYKLEVLPIAGRFSSLEKLWISWCTELLKIGDGLSTPACLNLKIMRCPRLRSIPDDSLSSLNCLGKLTIGGFSEELEEFPGLNSFQQLSASLRVLHLIGWEKIKSLPHQLQLFTALEDLTIESFTGLEALPDWLGNLSSLKRLQLSSCDNLIYLPSVDVMRSLSNLETFGISGCPQLKTKCANESVPEWSKISHIPNVIIDWKWIKSAF